MIKPHDNTLCLLHIDSNPEYAKSVFDSVYRASHGKVTLTNAESLERALKIFTVITFDAVVVDLNLSDCRGIEIIRKFKCLHPDIPIIVLTDVDDEPTIIETITGARGALRLKDLPVQHRSRPQGKPHQPLWNRYYATQAPGKHVKGEQKPVSRSVTIRQENRSKKILSGTDGPRSGSCRIRHIELREDAMKSSDNGFQRLDG